MLTRHRYVSHRILSAACTTSAAAREAVLHVDWEVVAFVESADPVCDLLGRVGAVAFNRRRPRCPGERRLLRRRGDPYGSRPTLPTLCGCADDWNWTAGALAGEGSDRFRCPVLVSLSD